jgi:hypothetical protein
MSVTSLYRFTGGGITRGVKSDDVKALYQAVIVQQLAVQCRQGLD